MTLLLSLTLILSTTFSSALANPATESDFTKRVIISNLGDPWEMIAGPDGKLWITEQAGKRIIRLNPSTGKYKVAVEIPEAFKTPNATDAKDGVLGLALHPDLLKGVRKDFVYVAFVRLQAGTNRTVTLRRYTYDLATETLKDPVELLEGLPGSNDHNSGRLILSPDLKMFYTIGDQGANQFKNKCKPLRSQDLPTAEDVNKKDYATYAGKILRLELDGSIPKDNPLLHGVRSHIWTYGHRNPQGLTFAPNGLLYSNEHGPKTDDELNLIEPGKNYGWPFVAGYRDDKAYVYGDWSASPECEKLKWDDYNLPASVPQHRESDFKDPAFTPPLKTFFTVNSDYHFKIPSCAPDYYVCWPSIAPSSLHMYNSTAIEGWANSFLITSLKKGMLYRAPLGADGKTVGDLIPMFHTTNRYRNVAISPDGQTLYIATDSTGNTKIGTNAVTKTLQNPGAILEFKYHRPKRD